MGACTEWMERAAAAEMGLQAAEKEIAELKQQLLDADARADGLEATVAVMREAASPVGGCSWAVSGHGRCPYVKRLSEALATDAGKPYLEVVEAARRIAKSIEMVKSVHLDGDWYELVEPEADALVAAFAKLDNPADSPATGSPQSDANPKEESDHPEG